MIFNVRPEGFSATLAALSNTGKQIPFATASALTLTAHDVNRAIGAALRRAIAGGPTPYTLRAFGVTGATKQTLTATVALKPNSPGTPYQQSLAHLFHGGVRRFKRLEAYVSARGILPSGLQLAPGAGLKLDSRGNAKQTDIREMLGILTASRRNFKSYHRSGRGKKVGQIQIGFFVVLAGSPASAHLHPGIYRRVEPASGQSTISPWFLFVRPGRYQRTFDLQQIAATVIPKAWPRNFGTAYAAAVSSAK